MKLISMLGVLIGLAVGAGAGPVIWTASGTFGDGGTLSGTFTYNADTNTYSAINLTTTAGTVRLSGSTYNFLCVAPCNGVVPDANGFLALTQISSTNLTGTPADSIFAPVPLTNAGGTLTGLFSLEADCSNSTCSAPAGPTRSFSNGTISAAPEPSTMLLLTVGAGLVWARRRFSAR